MFKRILIANRGEIAVRLIRACMEMNIESVAVYSRADKEALHVKLATKAICIGPERAKDSYLNMEAIISAALVTGCDAIHPGYGFLSENPGFVRKCQENGLIFIGPTADAMEALGNKSKARTIMKKAGVPVVPGSDGPIKDYASLERLAKKLGYPLLIKASAGGGGRGMRRVFSAEELIPLFDEARAETLANFNDDEMYLEKLIVNPRHIEFQILADSHGNVVHLGERDCSIQRKNQKLIEESPCMGLKDSLRQAMGKAAIAAAKAAGYTSAGTVEFVLDENNKFYFIEMNTRIQVEHGVTEMVTGIDLIKEQIRIAFGQQLSIKQKDIKISGHALECRINAEDPAKGFMANTGKITFLNIPGGPGVRVDTSLYNGYSPSPYYDSLMAKIIVHAPTRLEAIRRMRRSLLELVTDGVVSNGDFDYLLLHHPDFVKGGYNVGFIEDHMDEILGWDKATASSLEEK